MKKLPNSLEVYFKKQEKYISQSQIQQWVKLKLEIIDDLIKDYKPNSEDDPFNSVRDGLKLARQVLTK